MSKFNLTPRVQRAILIAKETALTLNSEKVTLEHLIFGILDIKQFTILNFFEHFNIPIDDFATFCFNSIEANFTKRKESAIKFSKEFKEIFILSNNFCSSMKHEYIGIEHIFYTLLASPCSPLPDLLKVFKVSPIEAKKYLQNCLENPKDETLQSFSEEMSPEEELQDLPPPQQPNSCLELYAKNYNTLALRGKFDKVYARDLDIEKISEILCRRKKNNPILVGAPGTGKTSLIEGLAQAIVSGKSTSFLASKIIYELDLASMIAGTKYRGQFEERIKNLLNEVKNNQNVILFIDEIHNIVGAGSAEGTMDAANILKPALAKNDIKCIGATTFKEYRKFIQKDNALERRFEKIDINPPSASKTYSILCEIISQYEKFHNVIYRKNALKLAIDLSVRYINDRQLPDKAIDIIDQAGSRVKIKNYHRPKAAIKIEQDIEDLMRKEDLNIGDPDFLKSKQDKLIEKYKKVLKNWETSYKNKKFYVTTKEIFEVIASRTGIPYEVISKNSNDILLNLKKDLNKKVFGQNEACDSVSDSIIRSRLGFSDSNKPIGSFLFLGQTGVGKTFMAKCLAETFFGSPDSLISIDMSEYAEKSNISRMIGSAPGYIGYDEGGQLTERVKQRPYSVILFDEIEKAHPDVLNILLQVLEEGRLTDNTGRFTNFSNCIIIMTSNIGASKLTNPTSLGFAQSKPADFIKDSVKSEVEKILSPELINRISEIIPFNCFNHEDIRKFVDSRISELKKKCLSKHKVKLNLSEDTINSIVKECSDLNMGLRPIERILQKKVESQLSSFIINKKEKEFFI